MLSGVSNDFNWPRRVPIAFYLTSYISFGAGLQRSNV
jgi:hypothetical protein